MIFFTIGTQLPFDRLVAMVDDVAGKISEPIIGQIGNTDYRPLNFQYSTHVEPEDFAERVNNARIIIGHAGIGTLLAAKLAAKPVIVMARQASLGEHRNDHQSATAKQLTNIQGVHVIHNTEELLQLLISKELQPMNSETGPSLHKLHAKLRSEISKGRLKRLTKNHPTKVS
ncbi:MAG: glucuronosyltransferase [Alteromonadaceae bacterium]|nr:glucuronosyltransferase [Alteromonadaceae bacterium]